jgi:hypothetical protein
MADNKSRALIHLTGPLLAILFAAKGYVGEAELWTMLALAVFTTAAMALALLAVRPPSRRKHGLGADGAIFDTAFIQADLVRGLHRLGRTLAAKHRTLRLAYSVFGTGVVVAAMFFPGSIVTAG